MSAQPNVDAGEIRHNAMKLAMTVGDSRHYVIDSIMPRHFLQTAANAAYPRLSSKAFSTKSKTKRIARLRLQWTACPPDFRIVSSVIEGLHRRLFAPGDDVKTPQNLRIL
jgi:serine/threonine-protein kinase HipA